MTKRLLKHFLRDLHLISLCEPRRHLLSVVASCGHRSRYCHWNSAARQIARGGGGRKDGAAASAVGQGWLWGGGGTSVLHGRPLERCFVVRAIEASGAPGLGFGAVGVLSPRHRWPSVRRVRWPTVRIRPQVCCPNAKLRARGAHTTAPTTASASMTRISAHCRATLNIQRRPREEHDRPHEVPTVVLAVPVVFNPLAAAAVCCSSSPGAASSRVLPHF